MSDTGSVNATALSDGFSVQVIVMNSFMHFAMRFCGY
jgi:hypothetical protein